MKSMSRVNKSLHQILERCNLLPLPKFIKEEVDADFLLKMDLTVKLTMVQWRHCFLLLDPKANFGLH